MKNHWFVSLITLLIVGAIAGCAASSRSVEETGSENIAATPTKTISAQVMVEKQPTPEAEMLEDPPTPQVEPTPTKAQMESQPTTPTQAVQPTDTPLAEPEPTEEVQPVATATPEPEPTPESPVVLLQGQFTDADQNHTGSGTATLYHEPDGSYHLSFEDFAICCGPDLYVFLASNPSPTSHADLGDYVEISSLQSPTGDQAYEIPADIDLFQINSVVIYCKAFQVIISTATFG